MEVVYIGAYVRAVCIRTRVYIGMLYVGVRVTLGRSLLRARERSFFPFLHVITLSARDCSYPNGAHSDIYRFSSRRIFPVHGLEFGDRLSFQKSSRFSSMQDQFSVIVTPRYNIDSMKLFDDIINDSC